MFGLSQLGCCQSAIRDFAAYKSGYVWSSSAIVREIIDTFGSLKLTEILTSSCAMRHSYSLAVVAAMVALCAAQKCPDNLRPNEVKFIPHETNCTSYYRCKNKEQKLEVCPSYRDLGPLCFNPQLEICDWSANVYCCNEFLTSPNPIWPSTGSTHGPPNPYVCMNSDKRPVSNCLKYQSDGIEQCCGTNLAFNPKLCLCDLRRNVKSCQPTLAELVECNSLKKV